MPNADAATLARRWITALRVSHDGLRALVGGYGPEEVRGPSYDDDWTIAQVLSHLGSGAEIMVGSLDDIARGEAPDNSASQQVWDRWNAKSPDDQAHDALVADAALVERWEAFDDDQLAAFSVSLFGMQLDASAFVGLRLGEHILHTWDIAVMADAGAGLAPEAAGLVASRLPLLAVYFGKADRLTGGPIRWVMRTSDPELGFVLEVGDGVRLTEDADATGDDEVRLPAEAFVRLLYGRLDPEHTPDAVSVSGAADLDELRRAFPGV
jgi:uncharacterized protein (TIGR03083 family)